MHDEWTNQSPDQLYDPILREAATAEWAKDQMYTQQMGLPQISLW